MEQILENQKMKKQFIVGEFQIYLQKNRDQ